jgi:hypothetical protein
MSGEMTLREVHDAAANVPQKPRRNRAMGNNESTLLTQDNTGWNDDEVFVAALDSSAFLAFDAQMDEAIDCLVARWAGSAAPNARVHRRSSKFPSAKPASKPK